MKNRRIFKIAFSLIFIFTLCFSMNIYAVENENTKELYSEDYKEYLKLSDKEKAKRGVIPEKFDVTIKEYFSKRNKMAYLGEVEEVPARFNLRDVIDVKLEDQGSYGLCWAFASANALETNLALNNIGEYDFSEMHANYLTSNEYFEYLELEPVYWRLLHDGGRFSVFNEYYALLENGPVLETEVPYVEVLEENYASLMEYKPEIYIHETVRFPDTADAKDEETKNIIINDIKNHIMKNGSLYASICSMGIVNGEKYTVLNEQDIERKYIRDHAISIIGWDDTFSKENFPEWCRPEEDGAYIALNSWGNIFEDDGIFYISYEDILVNGELSGVVLANKEAYKEITIEFKDVNLYSVINTYHSNWITEKNDETMTIKIKESYLKLITSLYLNDVQDFSGLENFVNLESISFGNSNFTSEANIEILKKLTNLKRLDISYTEIENWDFINELNIRSLSLWNTNFYDFSILDNNETIEELIINNEFYDKVSNMTLDLSNIEQLRRLGLSFGEEDKVIVTNLHDNMEYVNLFEVDMNATALEGCTSLEELTLSFSEVESLEFLTEDFTKLFRVQLIGTEVDLKPIASLEQEVEVFLSGIELENFDTLIKNPNLKIETWDCVIEEYLIDEIHVGSKSKIDTPKEVTYVYNYLLDLYWAESIEIKVTNGTINRKLTDIALNTEKKDVSIPLEITVMSADYDYETVFLKYIIYYDVIEKEGWFKDYAKITYSTHVEKVGWQDYLGNNQIAGTSGQALRLEGLKIDLDSNIYGAGIEYSTHVQNIGWQDYVSDDKLAGTEGQSLRLEAVKIKLSEDLELFYDIYYRVHAQNIGWMNWAKNGEIAGTTGMALRLEAIQIMLVEKNSSSPVPIPKPDCMEAHKETPHVVYNAHIENIGWTLHNRDGIAVGELGSNLRIEAFTADVESSYRGDIVYNAYVEGQGFGSDAFSGEIAGTEGQSLRIEYISLMLTDVLYHKYDIYYRVLLDNETTWQGWATDGYPAGTVDLGRTIQGIQMTIREKGSLPPKDTGRPAFIEGDVIEDLEEIPEEIPDEIPEENI